MARSQGLPGRLGHWRLDLGIARRQAALWARKNGRPEPILEEAYETEDPAVAAAGSVDLGRALDGLGPAAD